jgi:hypothetical protein
MRLTRVERERISDSRLKIQSVTDTLHHLDNQKVPGLNEIQNCLEDAEKSLSGALRSDN